MSCEPFDCETCHQRHERCTGHVDRLPDGTVVPIRPCLKWPRKGAAVCQKHGGNAPQVRKAAERKLIMASAEKMLGVEGFESISDPYTELSSLAGEVVKLKDVLRSKVEELTTLKDVGGDKVATQIDVLMSAYERGLDRCERILTNMARLDLDGKIAALQAKVDTATGEIVSAALTHALNAATIEPEARELILRAFGNALRGNADTDRSHVPAIAP